MANVEFEKLFKNYGDVKAVQNFNLNIQDGEFIVLVGPSGCGKSTTLRMIAGLEDITSGLIYIDKKVVNKVHPKNRDIAMVFQNYALYPHLSVQDNISFGLRAQKLPKLEVKERVLEAADTLGLQELLTRRPGELSGGQKQRVAMGRAIVRNPKVFLFDEPLSNLDAKLRHKMRAEMKKLHKKVGTTTIYVTHDQIEAMTLADRIVIMKDGLIEQVGTPNEVYKKPNNVFVASFIGTPAMNFIEGEVTNISNSRSYITLKDRTVLEINKNNFKNGQKIILGVRPEDINVKINKEKLDKDTINLNAEISVIEPMGYETVLICESNFGELTGKVESNIKLKESLVVNLNIKQDRIYCFDKNSKKRI
jgi:multiple sugar transport system ATP-binding protein